MNDIVDYCKVNEFIKINIDIDNFENLFDFMYDKTI